MGKNLFDDYVYVGLLYFLFSENRIIKEYRFWRNAPNKKLKLDFIPQIL